MNILKVALFLLFLSGIALAQDNRVLAFEEAKQLADQGAAYGEAIVAFHYSVGWQTEKNLELAAKYAISSTQKGHPLGAFRLGALLRSGDGVPKNEAQGIDLQSKAIAGLDKMAGNPYALTALGVALFQGKVVREDKKLAAQLYKHAADMGFAPAKFNFSMVLNDGHGVSKDANASQQYLRDALVAEYPPAQKFALEQAKSLNREQADAASAVEGVNSSGDRWAYEFSNLEKQNSKRHRLESPAPEDIVFANHNYIVLKRVAYLGVGRFSTSLFIYDARSLLLNAVISVPNNICAVDYSAERRQFVLLTISRSGEPWVKWPDDTGQALVLVDLQRRSIERVPLWRKNTSFYEYGGPDLAPRWDGNRVVLDKSKFPAKGSVEYLNSLYTPGGAEVSKDDPRADYPNFLEDMRFAKRCFSDVRVEVGQLEASKLAASGSEASLRKTGLEDITKLMPPKAAQQRVEGDDSPLFGVSSSDSNAEKFSMLLPSQSGKLVCVSLTALTSRVLTASFGAVDGVGVFEDGAAYVRSGSRVTVYPLNGRERSVNVGNLSVSSKASFSGKRLYFASYHADKEPAFQINGVSGDGQVSGELVAMDSDAKPDRSSQESEHSPRIYDFAIDGWRGSISLLTNGEKANKLAQTFGVTFSSDFSFNQWWEFDWRSGKLLVPPYEDESARGMFGAAGRFYGFAPVGWEIISQEASTTSGSENTISLKQIRTKNEVVVGTSPYALRGGKPLVALDGGNDSMLVISGGHRGAQVERVSLLGSNNVTKIAQYSWDDNQGDGAFFVSGRNWLVVPQEGGWEVIKLNASNFSCETLAEVYVGSGEDYAILLPSGSYAGSPGCESLLQLKAGDGSVDGSSVAQWRNRPAEVLKALGGDPEVIELLAKVTERWQKRIGFDPAKREPKASDLPKVSVPERPPLWATGETSGFTIEWQKGASPIKNVILRVNGVESARFQGDTLSSANQDKGSTDVTVKLAEGQNWIEVAAEDMDGRRSDLQRFRTILREAAKPTKRYIIAIGVSNYRDSALNLEFAAKDASDLAAAIKEITKGETEVLLLTNEQATKDAPAKIREFLATATENDEVVAFCAGHGVLDSNLDYVYASHEFDSANPSETGIKLDELVDAIGSSKSLKRLLLLDTCHSGQVGEKDEMLLAQMDTELPKGVRAVKQRGMSVKPVEGLSAEGQQRFIEEMFLLPGLHRGINIIGASGGAEFALESAQWNNGVFTASIIEALREKKADLNEDGRVSVGELRIYLAQRVSELTKGAQKPSVVAAERDQDFNLIRVANKTP